MNRARRSALVPAVALCVATLALAACTTDRAERRSRVPSRGVRIVLGPTDDGSCCVVTTVNPRSYAQTVICFVQVFDDAGRFLASRWTPPLPPGRRRSSGFAAPPGRFERGVYEVPIEVSEQRDRTTCRPAAWHGGAPI